MTKPITADAMFDWLLAIMAGVNDVPDDKDQVVGRATAAAVACEGLPASLLTRGAAVDALRSWHTYPSAAAIYAFLKVRYRPGGAEATPKPDAVPPGTRRAPVPAPHGAPAPAQARLLCAQLRTPADAPASSSSGV